MVDCHMHMVLDGENWRSAIDRHRSRPDEDFIRQTLAEYARLGVTYLRDGGDRWNVGKTARSMAGEYGITYRTPLFPICRRGHYGGFIGRQYDTMEEYRQLLAELRRSGADFVKLMISGLMDFDRAGVLTEPGLEPSELAELIRIAHGEGFSVMAHANGDDTVTAAAEAGVDSVEHGAYLTRRALDAMGAGGTIWVPTLSTIGNLRGKGRFQEQAVERILESAMENVAEFAALGGLIAPGSDAGAWAVPHGIGCQTEYALLNEVLGTSRDAVLNRGTAALRTRF